MLFNIHTYINPAIALTDESSCSDRLFEMGFAAQLREIMKAMEGSNARRQTLLFSATMPSVLVEFARAGLREPKIVRLDVETKISPLLKVFALMSACGLFSPS